mgnify:CR=1 FL=1|jgi:hypothetical protein
MVEFAECLEYFVSVFGHIILILRLSLISMKLVNLIRTNLLIVGCGAHDRIGRVELA